ncbi:MAG: spore coat U domain-containing protein [Acidobacteriia bacterium]|nr:spore coat U domain-containing protein [Terriglobia bacterium]
MKKTIGLAILLLFTASAAFAGTATSNMSVTATVVADCVVNSVGAMAFGANLGIPFTITGTNATASAAINYTCTNSGVAPTIRLGQGLNPAATSTDATPLRRMKDAGTDFISYALYKDLAHSLPWANTTATGVAGTANGVAQIVTAYGVATAANVPAGAYTDTVVVSVDF